MNPANFIQLLPLLCRWQVRFVLIGGGAAIVHGLARTTYDVDVVYDRAADNLEKLAFALQELSAYPRALCRDCRFISISEHCSPG